MPYATANGLIRIPCVLMRGGTSRGPVFREIDLPADPDLRDRVLIAALGSPHPLQVDGIGGGSPLTSKVAIVAKATRRDADVDYLFAQVSVERAAVDTSPNCGNMLAAVGPFAIETGLVPALAGETLVRIYNRNTSSLIEAVVQTPAGAVAYDGDVRIDGVADSAAPVRLSFVEAAGAKTGALLPTGAPSEMVGDLRVTLLDYAMPMMLVAASDLGLCGDETPERLDADRPLMARLEAARRIAGRRMGLGDIADRVVPKIGILSPPRRGGTLTSRYLVPDRCHRSHAVTGALCIAVASRMAGTVAFGCADVGAPGTVTIEHPSGAIGIELQQAPDGTVVRASLIRTARRLFDGHVSIAASVLDRASKIQLGGDPNHDHETRILYDAAGRAGHSRVA